MWSTKATYWLENDGSFAEGIALLQEKSISTRQMEPRSSKHLVTPEMKARLRQEIQRLVPQPPDGDAASPALETAPPAAVPREVEKLRDRGKRLMKQRSRLHALLSTAGSDAERYDIAREMCVKVQPKIDQVYAAIRQWERSGEVPPEQLQDDIVEETVKKMLRRDSIKVRMSQLRSRLKKPGIDNALRQQYEQEMAEKAEELAALEAALGL